MQGNYCGMKILRKDEITILISRKPEKCFPNTITKLTELAHDYTFTR